MLQDPVLERSAFAAAGRSAHPEALPALLSAFSRARGGGVAVVLAALVEYARTAAQNPLLLRGEPPSAVAVTRLLELATSKNEDLPSRKAALIVVGRARYRGRSRRSRPSRFRTCACSPKRMNRSAYSGRRPCLRCSGERPSADPDTRAACIEIVTGLADANAAPLAVAQVLAWMAGAPPVVVRAGLGAITLLGDASCFATVSALARQRRGAKRRGNGPGRARSALPGCGALDRTEREGRRRRGSRCGGDSIRSARPGQRNRRGGRGLSVAALVQLGQSRAPCCAGRPGQRRQRARRACGSLRLDGRRAGRAVRGGARAQSSEDRRTACSPGSENCWSWSKSPTTKSWSPPHSEPWPKRATHEYCRCCARSCAMPHRWWRLRPSKPWPACPMRAVSKRSSRAFRTPSRRSSRPPCWRSVTPSSRGFSPISVPVSITMPGTCAACRRTCWAEPDGDSANALLRARLSSEDNPLVREAISRALEAR